MTTTSLDRTDAELLALPRDGRKRELVDGFITASPAGHCHGRVSLRLSEDVLPGFACPLAELLT